MSVPALRFPEFSGEWEEKPLGEVATFSKGKGISKADIVEGGALPCVRYGELYTTYGTLIENIVSFTDVSIADLTLSEGGEILVPASGETSYDIATATVLPYGGVAIGGDLNVIETCQDRFFVASYIRGKGKKHLARMAQGNSVVHLYRDQIARSALFFPSIPEQNKIASFLEVVDEKLAALRARQAGLEAYKRGLMQKLFSRTLRFTKPDSSAFPDWEEKRLDDVFEWVKTNNLSRENLNYDEGVAQNIHYGDIHTKFQSTFRQPNERLPFVSDGAIEKGFSKDEFCRLGDVVIADASEDYADIGKAIEIVELSNVPLVAGLHTYIARPKIELVQGFSGYLMQSAEMRRQIMKIAQGISVLGISKTNLEKLELMLPHLDEQSLIAHALQAMDAKLRAVADQIARTEAFKKGLLQQMFV